jgi:endonuclease-3
MTGAPATANLSLVEAVGALAAIYDPPPLPADPLALILWENAGYLIDDQRRILIFRDLEDITGLTPGGVLAADEDALFALADRGGMRPEERVERWRTIATIVLDDCGGDLAAALRALPLPKARKLLMRFPMIGGPGADKILLFCGLAATPSIESNGLRVLARLGLLAEQPSYAANYKAATELLSRQGRRDGPWLIAASELLRAHGKALCRRGAPDCLACPLDGICAHIPVAAL